MRIGSRASQVPESPVRVGETGMVLPAGTRLCVTSNQLEVSVELPEGFGFTTAGGVATESSGLPFATYTCYCSNGGSPCNVFYSETLGFGCLQNSCPGSCTGKFTYKGYSLDKVIYTAKLDQFFELPAIKLALSSLATKDAYARHTLYGVSFYIVHNEAQFLEIATCDCEGTKACVLKVKDIQLNKSEATGFKIYYCEGGCNGCELTI